MNNQDIDFTEDFKELEARTKNINEKLNLYKNKARELQQQLEFTELSVKDAEQSVKSADKRAEEATEKYKKALELKDGQYEQLIHDLFKAPQKELISHMETHSKRSYNITMFTAVGSIIISLIISVYFQIQSSNSMNNLIAKMEESQRTTSDLLIKIDSVNENIWATDEDVKKIIQIIDEDKKYFNDYKSRNDVALLFKVRMIKLFYDNKYRDNIDIKYSDYIKAFRISGKINRELIPSEDELKNWDIQFMQLCEKAVALFEEKLPDTSVSNTNVTTTNTNANTPIPIFIAPAEKIYNTYKIEGDDTDYGVWGYNSTSTYTSLFSQFRNDLSAVRRRMNINDVK